MASDKPGGAPFESDDDYTVNGKVHKTKNGIVRREIIVRQKR